MKKIQENSSVAHMWANQLQDEATNSQRNFYFQGDTIYSYGRHFPIAVNLGNNVILMTSRTYSNTTAKHIGYVRSAITHKTVIYCYDPYQASLNCHSGNLEKFANSINNILTGITPKTRKPENYILSASQEAETAKIYITHFGIKPTPELKKLFALLESKNATDTLKEAAQKKLIEKEKAEAKKIKLQKKAVLYWKNYTPVEDIPNDVKSAGRGIEITYLRTNGKEIETSKGIKLSIPKAKMYYNWVQSVKATGCKDCNYTMQDYKVTEVNKTALVIGCHTIPHTEIETIAKELKF